MTREDERRLSTALSDAACTAAGACEAWVGKGDKLAADAAAVQAMRHALGRCGERFVVAIGEGELDQAPMLARGEKFGAGSGQFWDVAVDPLEGTTLCARGLPGAVTAIAAADPGTLLTAPDSYMDKVMAGPACPPNAVHVDSPIGDLVASYAKAAGLRPADIVVCTLDRQRHSELMEQVRAAGAQLRLLKDGDLPAALWVCRPDTFDAHLYVGTGGAPEGVLSAVLLKALGGSMSARMAPQDEAQRLRLANLALPVESVLGIDELVAGDAVLTMASVTGTPSLAPVQREGNRVRVEALTVSTRATDSPIWYHSAEIDAP